MPRPKDSSAMHQVRTSRKFQLAKIKLLGLQSKAAKTIFYDEQGQLSGDGAILLALLSNEARLNAHAFNGDADRRLFDAGAQHIVRTLFDWLEVDSAHLANAQQLLHDQTTGKV